MSSPRHSSFLSFTHYPFDYTFEEQTSRDPVNLKFNKYETETSLLLELITGA